MHSRTQLILASLAATLAMAFAVSSASANHLSTSHGSLFKNVFASLAFKGLGITNTACPVTMEGSFHSATISKVVGSLIGAVTHVTVGTCTTGHATVLSETLPWHIQYGGFREVLPEPRPILNLIGASFRVEGSLATCLTTTTATNPASAIAEPTYEAGGNGKMTGASLRTDPTRRIPCGGINGEFVGSATSVESVTGEVLLVRLI